MDNIPTALYVVGMGFSNDNGDDIGWYYSDTPSLEIIDEYLNSDRYNYSFEGYTDENGYHIDDTEFFYSSYTYDIDGDGIIVDEITDPEEIRKILYSKHTVVLGYENLNIYPALPPVQGPRECTVFLKTNDGEVIPF